MKEFQLIAQREKPKMNANAEHVTTEYEGAGTEQLAPPALQLKPEDSEQEITEEKAIQETSQLAAVSEAQPDIPVEKVEAKPVTPLAQIHPPQIQLKAVGNEGEQKEEKIEEIPGQLMAAAAAPPPPHSYRSYFAENVMQQQNMSRPAPQQPYQMVAKENNTGLPDDLKSGVENLSGFSMDDVKVHYNSDKPAQLNAHAYAQGTDIHVASGQEKHLAHEAWHVVQQKQGRVQPTKQMKGKTPINDDKGLEKEADVMGAKALLHVNTEENKAIQQKSRMAKDNNSIQLQSNNSAPIQLARKEVIARKHSHIVKRNGNSLMEGDFGKSINNGDRITISTSHTFNSRRGPNMEDESLSSLYDTGDTTYKYYKVYKINDEDLDIDNGYIRDEAFTDPGGEIEVQRNPETVRIHEISAPDRNHARQLAESLASDLISKESAYVFRGLGGGGASRLKGRSEAVRNFRKIMKSAARLKVFEQIDALSLPDNAPDTATSDYQRMIAGNIAFDDIKDLIDDQLKVEAEQVLDDLHIKDKVVKHIRNVVLSSYGQVPGNQKTAIKSANTAFKNLKKTLHDEIKARKNEIVGKGDSNKPVNKETATTSGDEMIKRVVRKTENGDVAQKSLEKAIEAPNMNLGMRFLGLIIDNAIPDRGEVINLSITFIIPTPQPGLTVNIEFSGMAARGIDGATTSGVARQADSAKRVEVMAKFSVGVGAEAIGLKSSAALGIFVRAGADEGTEAALQALSYGAYRGAPWEGFQNLWSTEDKSSEVRNKANKVSNGQGPQHPVRSKRMTAEMWAAMIEEQYFKGKGGTFADVGLSIDGGFGANFGVAEMELGISESLFSHYDEEVLKEKLGEGNVGGRVTSEQIAKDRRKRATGEKKLSLGGSINFKIGAGPHVIELGLAVSGSSAKNWGVEITGGASTATDEPGPTDYDKIMNGWVTGLGEMLKKLRSTASKQMNDDDTGAWGNILQVLGDGTTLLDVGNDHAIRSAMSSATESVTAIDPSEGVDFGTKVGSSIKEGATSKASALAASSMLQFVFNFGNGGSKKDGSVWLVKFELKSVRGIDVGGGSPVNVSASKSTILFAVEKEIGGRGSTGKTSAQILGGKIS